MPTVKGTLFHLLPRTTQGDHLLPLNQLRDTFPELHTRHARKYDGRESELSQPVAPLGCTWGDVVFLAPLHPAPVFAALNRSGRSVSTVEPATIDAGRLDPTRCVIRLMRHGTAGHFPDPIDDDDYLPFTTASLRAVNRVTVAAIERLENLPADAPWLPWVDVPHVLHRGPIDLALFTRPGRVQ